MRRHVGQDHETELSARTKPACQQCRTAKTRCIGSDPCQRCAKKGLQCSSTGTTEMRKSPSAGAGSQSSETDDPDNTQHYIDLYFQHFHPQWPFLHRATFSADHEPPLLVYSVMVIGLWASGRSSPRASALALHDKIGKDIWQQKVSLQI